MYIQNMLKFDKMIKMFCSLSIGNAYISRGCSAGNFILNNDGFYMYETQGNIIAWNIVTM